MTRKICRTYSELISINGFEDRFRYLSLVGSIGGDTFGFDRWMNQQFYRSKEWKRVRDEIIFRDSLGGDYCCDLACEGYELHGPILIHHMNPITQDDIIFSTEYLLNPEYLIATCKTTHNAIHYGTEPPPDRKPIERFKNDTIPWR